MREFIEDIKALGPSPLKKAESGQMAA